MPCNSIFAAIAQVTACHRRRAKEVDSIFLRSCSLFDPSRSRVRTLSGCGFVLVPRIPSGSLFSCVGCTANGNLSSTKKRLCVVSRCGSSTATYDISCSLNFFSFLFCFSVQLHLLDKLTVVTGSPAACHNTTVDNDPPTQTFGIGM